MKYSLVDCQELNREHPSTFQIPSAECIAAVEVGHSVKLFFEDGPAGIDSHPSERMWVDVTYIGLDADGQYFEGTLANDPVVFTELTHGHPIVFRPRHICCI